MYRFCDCVSIELLLRAVYSSGEFFSCVKFFRDRSTWVYHLGTLHRLNGHWVALPKFWVLTAHILHQAGTIPLWVQLAMHTCDRVFFEWSVLIHRRFSSLLSSRLHHSQYSWVEKTTIKRHGEVHILHIKGHFSKLVHEESDVLNVINVGAKSCSAQLFSESRFAVWSTLTTSIRWSVDKRQLLDQNHSMKECNINMERLHDLGFTPMYSTGTSTESFTSLPS